MSKKIGLVLAMIGCCLWGSPVTAGLAPANFGAMYTYAAQGKLNVLQDAMHRGLDIDSVDENGNTGLCIAIWRNSYSAYNTFRKLGADAKHSCVRNIPQESYNSFAKNYNHQRAVEMRAAASVAASTSAVKRYNLEDYKNIEQLSSNSNMGYVSYDPNERPLIESDTAWMIGGVALVGGGIAIAMSGGGGSDDDDGVKNIPGMSGVKGAPYVVAADIDKNVMQSSGAEQSSYWGVYMPGNQNIINSKDITITNTTSTAGSRDHWGAIYTKNGYAYNSGDIMINSSNKYAKGIMSCIVDVYNPYNTACIVDKNNPMAGDIQNVGSIKIIADQSMGIFSTTTRKITNSGLIDLTGNDNTGIWLLGDGGVENSGKIILNGSKTDALAGSMSAIWVSGTSNVNNSGKISVVANGGTASNGAGMGIYVKNGSVTNGGGISISGNYGTGIEIYEGNVNNNGSITMTGNRVTGIKVDVSGEVVNNGTITLAGGGTAINSAGGKVTNTEKGVIDSKGDGINASGDVINKGKITANGTAVYGASVTNDGNITSQSGIGISASSVENNGTIVASNGISTTGGTSTNNEKGLITVFGIGMMSEAGQIINKGTVNANVAAFYTESGSIENSGTVTSEYGASAINGSLTNTKDGKMMLKNSAFLGDNGGDTSASGTFINEGVVTIDSSTNDNVYGVYTPEGITVDSAKEYSSLVVNNSGLFTLNIDGSTPTGTIAAIFASENGNITNTKDGVITINNKESISGKAIGIASGAYVAKTESDGSMEVETTKTTISNAGKITINSFNSNEAYGIKMTGEGTATNSGELVVNANNSYGMAVYYNNPNLKDPDSGEIDVQARIINSGKIVMNGKNNVAMYAEGIGSAIQNTGTIEVKNPNITDVYLKEGDAAYTGPSQCDSFICLKNGAIYENAGTTASTTALNLNGFSGDGTGAVYLMNGGKFVAPEISGKVIASSEMVKGGNDDTYTSEDAFEGEDAGIDLKSGSYLFNASLKDAGDGSKDVYLERKNFNEVMDNGSAANFLENNYIQGNNLDLYDTLKMAASRASLGARANRELALDFFPNFAKQNLDLIKSLNRSINNSVLNNTDSKDERATVGYDYLNRNQDGDAGLQGYEDDASTVYGMFDKKYDNNWRYGWGLSYSKFNSKYDNSNKRNENIIQVFAPVSYQDDLYQFITTPRIGYGWGDYSRFADDGVFSADVGNYYYGIGNELRSDIDLGYLVFEPLIEFNILGLYQDGMSENNKLDIDGANNLSVEGGLGLYLKKSFDITDNQRLNLRAGGTVYYEFADPYAANKAKMSGMNGSYHMNSYAIQRTRAVLSARAEYQYKQMNLYSQFNKYIEDADAYEINAGLDWRF